MPMQSERFDPSQCDLLESAIARCYEMPWEALENKEADGAMRVPELGVMLVRAHLGHIYGHTTFLISPPHVGRIVGIHVRDGQSDAEIRFGWSKTYEHLLPGYRDWDLGMSSRMVPLYTEVSPNGVQAIDFILIAEYQPYPGTHSYKHEYVRALAEIVTGQPELMPHAEVLLGHIDADLAQLEDVRRVIRGSKGQ